MDREKVIEGLENLRETIRTATQYTFTSGGICAMSVKRINNALVLLKEQEAVSITTDYFDGFGNRTSHCPSCNSRLVWHQNKNYCGECGRSVKWNES